MSQSCALWAVWLWSATNNRYLSCIPIYFSLLSLSLTLSISIWLTRPYVVSKDSQHGETVGNPIPSTTMRYYTTSEYTSLGGLPPPSSASPQSAPLSRTLIIGVPPPQPPTCVSFLPLSQILEPWTPSFAVIRRGRMTTNFEPSLRRFHFRSAIHLYHELPCSSFTYAL